MARVVFQEVREGWGTPRDRVWCDMIYQPSGLIVKMHGPYLERTAKPEQVDRHLIEPRDALDRRMLLETEGVAKCIGCDRYSAVCPQDIDPGTQLAKMKQLLKDKAGENKGTGGC
ncbi:MAG: hypothetical protein H0Z35_08740 [Thermoanaerobacteraceae bacterium]|nr:hypothetical protein [Thermoanaerobacteraceae bacterium]